MGENLEYTSDRRPLRDLDQIRGPVKKEQTRVQKLL